MTRLQASLFGRFSNRGDATRVDSRKASDTTVTADGKIEDDMQGDRRLRRLSARCAPLVLAVLPLVLPACDPPTALPAPKARPAVGPFAVEAPTIQRNGQVLLHFSAPLDAASVGRRSVSILHRGSPLRLKLKVDGSDLRIAPHLPRRGARNGSFVLRIEGAPSPRAVRSAAGGALGRRVEWTLDLARTARSDLTPPYLVASQPVDGDREVAPGQDILLRFSEALDRSAVRNQRRFQLYVDGKPAPSKQRLVEGRTAVLLRPASPLPPSADVEVRTRGVVLDLAGNALERAPRIRFRTWATHLREITEEFQTYDMADVRATNCSWCEVQTPGFLVWSSGRRVIGPLVTEPGRVGLAERSQVRFQMIVAADDEVGGDSFASALRLVFLNGDVAGGVLEATVDAGISDLDRPGPAFESNRLLADVLPLGAVERDTPIDIRRGEDGFGRAEIPFLTPLAIPAGANVLLDVTLTLAPGVRLVAVADEHSAALLDRRDGARVVPIAQLLVTGGVPQARSLWYDSGVARPDWRRQALFGAVNGDGVTSRLEFQVAPALRDGRPDVELASSWEQHLDALPSVRFVRFRARFEGFPLGGQFPRIDRIVMPFESR